MPRPHQDLGDTSQRETIVESKVGRSGAAKTNRPSRESHCGIHWAATSPGRDSRGFEVKVRELLSGQRCDGGDYCQHRKEDSKFHKRQHLTSPKISCHEPAVHATQPTLSTGSTPSVNGR